jgi:hypothetical protein
LKNGRLSHAVPFIEIGAREAYGFVTGGNFQTADAVEVSLQMEARMATANRFNRFIAEHSHAHADHAAWWELTAYWVIALLVGLALASVFSFAIPHMVPGL